MSKAQVVMADVFGKYYDKLDGSVQAQVLQFIMKMQRDPDATGLNLKPPKGAEDKRVRTARINDNFRAVLMHYADRIYYLVAVLPHDDAYTLASHIIFDINKVTGGVELINLASLHGTLSGHRPRPPPPRNPPSSPMSPMPISTGSAYTPRSYRRCARSAASTRYSASWSICPSSPGT